MALILLIPLTVYAWRAHAVASHVYEEDSEIYWQSSPAGSLFPWPAEPGPFMALSTMSHSDVLIYQYLVKTWALLGVFVLLYVVTGIYAFK